MMPISYARLVQDDAAAVESAQDWLLVLSAGPSTTATWYATGTNLAPDRVESRQRVSEGTAPP